jgi:uncharacterized protein YfaS (alpha-2-macroglobulin family)
MKTFIPTFLSFLLMTFSNHSLFSQASSDYYSSAWKKVEEAEDKGLPETALSLVKEIYAKSTAENNEAQTIKALIYQLKLADEKEDNALPQNILQVESELSGSKSLVKQCLLHSMLGEMYWHYYQNNRWKFANRSNIAVIKQEDLETWSLDKIFETTLYHYRSSCTWGMGSKDPNVVLKTTDYNRYTPLFNKGNKKGQHLRPTLLDFLGHRALDFFKSEESNLFKPAETFRLDKKEFMGEASSFINEKLETKDTLSTRFYALGLFQVLTQLHLADKEPDALIELELERLQFVKQYAGFPNETELYMVALQHLSAKYKTFPASSLVAFELASEYYQQGNQYKALQGEENKWKLKTAFDLCEATKKSFPNSDGALKCENLQNDIKAKSLHAQVEDVNVPDQAFRALIQYKNVLDISWRVIKVSREEIAEQRKKNLTNYNVDREEKFLAYFLTKAPIKSGHSSVPNDKDYQLHASEIKIEALPIGEYMLIFSHQNNFDISDNGLAYAFCTVSNLSYIHRNLGNTTTELYVMNREEGTPIPDAKVQIFFKEYDYSTRTYIETKGDKLTTSKEGLALLPDQQLETKNRNGFFFEIQLGADRVCSQKLDDVYGYDRIYQSRQGEIQSEQRTLFFLDRAIYRPGQTLYFKGLSIETRDKSSKIQANRPVTVIFRDVNGQEVGRQAFTTNEYGTFQGTFVTPTSGLLGQMTLSCSDGSGTSYFSVEEYKRPKFEVLMEPLKGTFRLGDSLHMEGLAKAYSGAALSDASVAYRVVRKARFPYWWWCGRGYYPDSPQMEITNGETITDGEGKFKVPFIALPDLNVNKNADPSFTYTVYVDVTDINGETHSAESEVTIGYKALIVGVDISDIDLDNPTFLSKKWQISTNNQASQFEPAQGSITIHKLQHLGKTTRERYWEQADKQVLTKEEYAKFFPLDEYADESNELKWPKGALVFQTAFDTQKEKSFVLEKLKTWEQGKYLLEITSKDRYGQEVHEVAYFTVSQPSTKTLAVPSIHYFHIEKATLEPGETAHVTVGSSLSVLALFEVEQDGKILKKEWLHLKNEIKQVQIPIKEEYRGDISVHFTFVKDNRWYASSQTISVPYTNKELDIRLESFRDKMQPGSQEEWRIKLKGKTADKLLAEMVATMYDASLDVFKENYWTADFWRNSSSYLTWFSQNGFTSSNSKDFIKYWNNYPTRTYAEPEFDGWNWFGYYFNSYSRRNGIAMKKSVRMDAVPASSPMAAEEEQVFEHKDKSPSPFGAAEKEVSSSLSLTPPSKPTPTAEVSVRKNFNETAFFYPNLTPNENGEILLRFTMPEALTRWKMMGFAHTKDLQSGFLLKEVVTQKDLMVVPNPPRFFRDGDKMTFSSKITSLTDSELKGIAKLEFIDAFTGKIVSDQLHVHNVESGGNSANFIISPKSSTNVEWEMDIPEGFQALTYRITAQAGSFSDGEEMTLPVVTNRTLVTESLPLPIRGKQTKTFRLEKLLQSDPSKGGSSTLKNHKYTLEFTSNPAWYAVQALPYLMEYPYECVEQTFSRYYANTLASHIANSHPRIKQVFDLWRNAPSSQGKTNNSDALLSNLEKNQELKSALLEETPWVLQAKDETARKRQIALLFDLNRMAAEQESALLKIQKAQTPSGGFAWFPGMDEDVYMTTHLLAGLGHLDIMGVKSIRNDPKTWQMVTLALTFLDRSIQEEYELILAAAKRKEVKLEEHTPSYMEIHYLYTRSYFNDIEIEKSSKEAFDFFLKQTKKYWLQENVYMQGMVALALHRFDQKSATEAIIKSLKERALHSEELGMYYKDTRGYYWYQMPIETQALMIEVFDEVAGDQKAVEDLKVWLLKQKQTQDWKTTKATSEACYALLRRGTDVLSTTQIPEIEVGGTKVPTKETDMEAGTGYFKTSWNGEQIKAGMGEITIRKKDEGAAWGAVYWQYMEQLDKISFSETPLKLSKQLFLQKNTDSGPLLTPITNQTDLKVGDLVKVRIELRSDRNMEYLHLKDMRASGFEPISTLSESKYQDGLWYYESPRDLNTSFFIGYLPKGTYVFEYALRVSQKGDFSNGITSIQCMYAPEFSSHSEGVRVTVK